MNNTNIQRYQEGKHHCQKRLSVCACFDRINNLYKKKRTKTVLTEQNALFTVILSKLLHLVNLFTLM